MRALSDHAPHDRFPLLPEEPRLADMIAPPHDANERPHHDHRHGASGHAHAPKDFGRAFIIGIALNSAFVVVEAVSGILAGSMALLADAGHNLSDVLGLAVAYAAVLAAKKKPTARLTYGLGNASILAALVNVVLTLTAAGAIGIEAVQRLFSPSPVAAITVVIVAGIGALINAGTAVLFVGGRASDLNIRGAYLHMAADAAVSVGVVVSGLLIMLTALPWLDPVTSLVIVAVIIVSAFGLLRESAAMSFAAVPKGIDPVAVRAFLAGRPSVSALHDLHIWPLSTTDTALTAHLVMPEGHPGDQFLHDIAHELHARFGIGHATLQIEITPGGDCHLAPDDTL